MNNNYHLFLKKDFSERANEGMDDIWEKPISHGEILKTIWKNLDLGTLDRKHPFHLPVLSTICDGAPRSRIVVLRRFWRKNPRGLAFHAHTGSPKISEIRSNPKVSFLFYHPQDRFQVCARGTARVLTEGELHDEQWLATEFFSRRCYVGAPPSQPSDKPTSGLPVDLIDRAPTETESETGKAHFAVVFSTIDEIDCLEMNVRGHRRSFFKWHESGELETNWLTP